MFSIACSQRLLPFWQWERRSQQRNTSFMWTVQRAPSLLQNSPIWDPKSIFLLWRGLARAQTLPEWWGGHPFPTPHPPRRAQTRPGVYGASSAHLLILEPPLFGSHTSFIRKRWWRSIVVRTPVTTGELSLSCARLMAGRVTTLWVRRPLSVNQHGQLSLPSLRGRLNE